MFVVVQLEDCSANYRHSSTPVKIRESQWPKMLWGATQDIGRTNSSNFHFTVWGGFTCRPTSGACCTFITYAPSSSLLQQLLQLEWWIPLLLNSSRQDTTSSQPGFGKRWVEGSEEWSWRRDKGIEEAICFVSKFQTAQLLNRTVLRHVSDSKQYPHCYSKCFIM